MPDKNNKPRLKAASMAFQLADPGGFVMLCPPADEKGVINARDGRRYFAPLSWDSVLLDMRERYGDAGIPMDFNHAGETWGHPDPKAVGWLRPDDIEVRGDGSVWGKPEWNKLGRECVEEKYFKWISPTFWIDMRSADWDRDIMGMIAGLKSCGLTNDPALENVAINSRRDDVVEDGSNDKDDFDMKEEDVKKMLAEFQANIVKEVAAQVNAVRAEYVEKEQQAVIRAAVNTLVEQGFRDGKIAAAQRTFFTEQFSTKDGVAALSAFLETAPVIIPTAPTAPTDTPPAPTDVVLEANAVQRAMAESLGLEPEEYMKQIHGLEPMAQVVVAEGE